jgi:signal transduction histidine kinase
VARSAVHKPVTLTEPAAPAPAAAPARAAHGDFDPSASLEDQKRAFLRLVSHELRTPLNSILGFSEILSAELLGPLGHPQYREYAGIIRGSGKKLLRLVNQVLEIGRLEGLKLEVRSEPLGPALEETLAQLAEEIAAQALSVSTVAEADDALVMADAWGLRTVLTHLIQNAVAFSPQGGELRLRVRRAGTFVDVVIEDDGPGVDPADLPRLMKPFEQGQAALVRHGEGAGLGLTIAELTCQAMGARLSLRPGRDGGTSARVRLKAAAQDRAG